MTDQPDPVAALLAGVRQFAKTNDDTTGREALVAGARQYLADLDEQAFNTLVNEVRPPEAPTASPDPNYPPQWGFQPQQLD